MRSASDRVRARVDRRGASWRGAGLARQISAQAVRRARIQFFLVAVLIAAIMAAYAYRRALFGLDEPIRVATAITLVILGWSLARSIARWLGPALFRRMDAGTAGTVGFLIRLATVVLALLVALRIAGLAPGTLAVGGAFTAVIPRPHRTADPGQPVLGLDLAQRTPVSRRRARAPAGRKPRR